MKIHETLLSFFYDVNHKLRVRTGMLINNFTKNTKEYEAIERRRSSHITKTSIMLYKKHDFD